MMLLIVNFIVLKNQFYESLKIFKEEFYYDIC